MVYSWLSWYGWIGEFVPGPACCGFMAPRGATVSLRGFPLNCSPTLDQAPQPWTSDGYNLSTSIVQLGEAYLLAQRGEDARACADRAVTLAREGGGLARDDSQWLPLQATSRR